jgi:2-keto-3-deoxy-L-rhamnonate aldolase RhmA
MPLKVNIAKQALRDGRAAIGTMMVQFRSAAVPLLLSRAGMDFIIIDNEHSAFSLESNQEIMRGARECGLAVLVRVPDPDYHLIARTLDSGADGVMVPRVETAETVQAIVDAVKYPPVGHRGYGLGSIHTGFEGVPVADAIKHFNDNTLIIIQIESREAVERAEELVSVPGVDVALVGPVDLSISLGIAGQIGHDRVQDSYQKVLDAARKHAVHLGLHLPDLGALKQWFDRGARFLCYASEEGILFRGASAAVAELRAHMT